MKPVGRGRMIPDRPGRSGFRQICHATNLPSTGLPLGRRDKRARPVSRGQISRGQVSCTTQLHDASFPTASGLMGHETDEASTGRFIGRFQGRN
jgi:hypothetical protein